MRRLLGAAGLVLAAACGSSPPVEKSDWELQNEAKLRVPEEVVTLPAYPGEAQLVRFFTLERSDFHFLVDAASIKVGRDVVQYTLVARSKGAPDNVTFEGMRCPKPELKVYAVGRDGGWAGKPGAWRAFEAGRTQPWHLVLYRDFFCPGRAPISSPEKAAAVLRRGGMRGMTD